jgi:hypothetical protein
MKIPSNPVPVSVEVSASEVLQGIGEIQGTLEAGEERIEFAYRTKSLLDNLSAVHRLSIPIDDLRDVEYIKSAIGAKLVFRPRRLEIMEQMPGDNAREMVFKVKRADRTAADRLAAYLKYRLYEQDIDGDVVPFTLPDKHMGFTEVSGLAYIEDNFLVLDVLENSATGSTEDHHVIKIELKALLRVQYNPGVIKDVLIVRPKGPELLDALPGKNSVEVELSVRRRHREAAEALARRVQAYLESARIGSSLSGD